MSKKYLTPAAMIYQTKNGVSLPYQVWCYTILTVRPASTEFKSTYATLSGMNYSLPCNSYPTGKMLLDSHYYIDFTIADKLHSLMSPAQSFISRTQPAMFTVTNYPPSFCVPLTKIKFHSDCIFPRAVTLWNTLLSECFPDNYNTGLFKSRVN